MNAFFHIFLFILILFMYIHIVNQYKTSEDLEIYEMDYVSNTHLQEVCSIKQPVLFHYKNVNPEFFDALDNEHLGILEAHDVKIKDSRDYYNEGDNNTVDYTVMSYRSADTLMKTDTKSSYFIEHNHSLPDDAGLLKSFQSNDELLKPPMTVTTHYDILAGSKNVCTPLRYHNNERHLLCVITGKITIKMTPWKSSKYLYQNKDYDTYEFWSPIQVWKPQRKYFHEMDKLKFLEFDVNAGYIVSIPPYWWYSIKYDKNPETLVTSFTYNTAMNCIATLPDTCLYFMQQQNIKKRVAKTIVALDTSADPEPQTGAQPDIVTTL